MIEVIQEFLFDMETSDPDDVFTLALLATHPRVKLVGATLHPGGFDQVGVVRHVLDRLGRTDVPIGVGSPKKQTSMVSQFHYDWLGKISPCQPQGSATEVIKQALLDYPNTHLITGAALTNIWKASAEVWPFFKAWTCQGGFAGDNIVPPEHRLPKFDGKLTCRTFNLGGDSKAALGLLGNGSPIQVRRMVSKNVCHGVFWGPEVNARIPSGAHPGLDLIKEGMSHYFKKRPDGKALHDTIAAAAAIDPSIGTWVAVRPYMEKGEWGCLPSETTESETQDSPPSIMISLDIEAFERTLVS